MEKNFITKIIVFCLFLFLFIGVNGQQQARPIDNTILEKPEPLFTVEFRSGNWLLTALKDSLKRYGFRIIKFDNRNMTIEATKSIANDSKDFDKVIVWVERDYQMPEKYVEVFFLFGRFVEIISSETKVRRIEVTKNEEDMLVGELKKSLISISLIN